MDKKTFVIGITGSKRAGKDSVGNIISRLADVSNRISFAQPLKELTADALNITTLNLEQLKDDEASIIIDGSDMGVTARTILQKLGQGCKNILGFPNLWADIALTKIEDEQVNIITDMRMIGEYDKLKKYCDDVGAEFITISIARASHTVSADEHFVEHSWKEIPVEYHIDNNGSLSDLKDAVSGILKERCVII